MDLKEMREIADRRTPGDWEHRYGDCHHGVYFGPEEHQHIARGISGRGDYGSEEAKANAECVVMAVNKLNKFLDLADAVAHLCKGPTDMFEFSRQLSAAQDALKEVLN